MSTEQLIVQLDARTAKLEAKLKSSGDAFDKLNGKVDKADSKLTKLSKAGGIAAKGVTAVATAAVTGTIAMVAMVKSVAKYSKELKIASDISGVTTENLQTMGHATATVGIGIEKLGSISKDAREKVGDFLNTGGGGFMDFVDAMKLTKAEAKEVANEFSHMSGPEILQEMVTRMEDANVSAVQMSHALEGMALDTTNLIPLLKDGGKEMKRLSDEMAAVTIPLTDEDIKTFTDMGESVDKASASFKSFTEQTLLDNSEMFKRAADAVAWYFSTLNEGTKAWNKSRLVSIGEEIEKQEAIIEKTHSVSSRFYIAEETNAADRAEAQEKINALLIEQGELIGKMAGGAVDPSKKPDDTTDKKDPTEERHSKELQALFDRFKTEEELLTEKYKIETALASENKDLLLELEAAYQEDLLALKENNSIDAIAERFMTEQELLQQKLNTELEIIGENDELKLQLLAEFEENSLAIKQDALDKEQEAKDKQAKKDEKERRKLEKLKAKTRKDEDKQAKAEAVRDKKMKDDSMALAAIVFEDSKGASAALAFINTAEGVTAALSKYDFVGAGLIAAAGAVQISAITSTSKGGGGSSPSVGSGPSSSQKDFQEDTASLDVNSATDGGSQTDTITFPRDSGDRVVDLIFDMYEEQRQTGAR